MRLRVTLALAVLFATARFATAQLPPDWEPGCSPTPLSCVAGRGSLKLSVPRRSVAWTWTGGLVSISDLAKPTVGDRFDFCVYDGSNALVLAAGVPPGGACGGRLCWRARAWGFQYRDRSGSTSGFKKIDLKVAGRRDRLVVKAAGPALPMPPVSPLLPVTVQLVRTPVDTLFPESCWSSTYPPS